MQYRFFSCAIKLGSLNGKCVLDDTYYFNVIFILYPLTNLTFQNVFHIIYKYSLLFKIGIGIFYFYKFHMSRSSLRCILRGRRGFGLKSPVRQRNLQTRRL